MYFTFPKYAKLYMLENAIMYARETKDEFLNQIVTMK